MSGIVDALRRTVEELEASFDPDAPVALRLSYATLHRFKQAIAPAPPTLYPYPFGGITLHIDRTLADGEVVPMNAAEERAWLLRHRPEALEAARLAPSLPVKRCAVCDRVAPLVDGECPDCRH